MNADTPKLMKQGRFLMPAFEKEVSIVMFAEGRLLEYEQIMRQKPGFNHRPIKTVQERDCPHCLHFDNRAKKCSLDKCIIFEN